MEDTKRTSGTRLSLRAAGSSPLVILAEDEHDLRAVLEEVLRAEGYTVIAVDDAEALERAVERFPACALIADLHLGPSTSEAAIRELVARGQAGAVILCSASTTAINVAARHGVQLVAKPFDLDALLRSVRRAHRALDGASRISAG